MCSAGAAESGHRPRSYIAFVRDSLGGHRLRHTDPDRVILGFWPVVNNHSGLQVTSEVGLEGNIDTELGLEDINDTWTGAGRHY